MGSMMSAAMDENMEKQKVFQKDLQFQMLERNMNMQNAMRERMMATQIAGTREMLNWTGSFWAVAVLGLGIGAIKKGNPVFIAPLFPLTWVVGYQWDTAYNGKMTRITSEAENILKGELSLVNLAMGLPTVAELDSRRAAQAAAHSVKK
ncbi:plasminogen receptor (KT)-like [Watersipora subatra]|uniref:plasminogen receptor (KT)-like n=1 Tax=Watersipora subatra TaxID=2589382 RepID=UPI00355B03B0